MALTEFHDDALGTVTWDHKAEAWTGEVEFGPGRKIPLSVEFDVHNPSDADKLAAIRAARAWFQALDFTRESELRREAAARVIEEAWSQDHDAPPPAEAEQLCQEMELISLSLWSWEDGTGEFIYSASDCTIQVVLKSGMVIDEVMVYSRNRR